MIPSEIELFENRAKNFIQRLKSLFYEQKMDLSIKLSKFNPHVDFDHRLEGTYQQIDKNITWGKDWDRVWFHLTGSVPSDWQDQYVVARVNMGGESLVFDNNGVPITGLSVHTLWPTEEFWRDIIHITNKSKGNEKIDFWIESTAGQIYGLFPLKNDYEIKAHEDGYHHAAVQYAELATFRKDIWDLYLDCLVCSDLMISLPAGSVRRKRILRTLGLAIDQFTGDKETTEVAQNILKVELDKNSSDSDLRTQAIGHAHLDTAWLWTVDETIRKCGRTFSTQIDLLERYPNYHFGASQAQLYDFTKQNYPALYQKIKEKVKQGRWEVQGGMWVEADCNVISGESMVRQFLLGKMFFKDEFDVDVDNLWLPDVFGYSAALPQIMQKSGVKFFLTQKIAWSQFNKFPHKTFIWRGIDGSEVISHFPPGKSYASHLLPSDLITARNNFEESDRLDEFLTLFGICDGGSGPTEEMIETGIRQSDLEGTPKVAFGHARDFFHRLEKYRDLLPLWRGELYLEYHRGTLTTNGLVKKMNRFLELKLRQVEILYSLLPLEKYPGAELEKMWKLLLLNQFHDIIPGTSIPQVYETTQKQYKEIDLGLDRLEDTIAQSLLKDNETTLTIINTLSTPYHRPICLPQSWAGYELKDEAGTNIPVQIENNIPVIKYALNALQVMSVSRSNQKNIPDNLPEKDDHILENDLIRYEFDNQGCINRIFDKQIQREILTDHGRGNLFGLYEDRPVNWDAWDIDIFYENQLLEHPKLMHRDWLCSGPVRKGLSQVLSVGNSQISQNIYLDHRSKRLDFETTVDWQENHKMLRVSFTVNVFSDTASFEIQFGHVRRNTHRNTSWDMAKFEVVGHRFADLSDKQYGIALLNDSKYGYKIYDNIIDLNLLRSPTVPDPTADRGRNEFTYTLLPHENDLVHSEVISEAAQLNQPPVIFPGKENSGIKIPFQLDTDQIILDTVKKAERDNAWIVRLYEPRGMRIKAKLSLAFKSVQVFETDLMENEISQMDIDANKKDQYGFSLCLTFKPFEIKTIKIK
jgi:alpha-mannosidase